MIQAGDPRRLPRGDELGPDDGADDGRCIQEVVPEDTLRIRGAARRAAEGLPAEMHPRLGGGVAAKSSKITSAGRDAARSTARSAAAIAR
eukprot:12066482-Alexandrium_andersonii.AAC.1